MPLPSPESQPSHRTSDTDRLARGWEGLAFRTYDLWVVHGTYWAAWGCRWPNVYRLYEANVGRRHLEVGPGTGYFLNRLNPDLDELHLVDKFDGPLAKSRQALARFSPHTHSADVLKPLPLEQDSMDSAGAGWMLHCVEGDSFAAKAPVFDNIARVLKPGAPFFGCTILPEALSKRLGVRLNERLNAAGYFSNQGDTRAGLENVLSQVFDPATVEVRVVGAVALFKARAH